MNQTLVLAGSLAQKPGQGGHTWVFLQYLLGFRRLGWDVLFLDRLLADQGVDPTGARLPSERSGNVQYVCDVMRRHGLADSFAIACDKGDFIGLSRQEVLERVRRASVFINVMGFFDDAEILAAARWRVFLDIDPGFGQMWQALGLHDAYRGYDDYVTVGERVGRPDCLVPDCGRRWITTRPPVVLEHWPWAPPVPDGPFTSIATWRGAYAPIEYRGRTYGLRAHEFRKFVTLPCLTGAPFEVALAIHPAETKDLALLEAGAWRLIDPTVAAGDPPSYRQYIGRSKAEFLVAKNMYVQSKSGWFSDRSVCYLATGRPVLAQDTGLADLYPVGKGLLTFSTLEEAVGGVRDINARYDMHCRAARQIAVDFFDSDKVLTRFAARLGFG